MSYGKMGNWIEVFQTEKGIMQDTYKVNNANEKNIQNITRIPWYGHVTLQKQCYCEQVPLDIEFAAW